MLTHDERIQQIQADNIEVNDLFAEELPDHHDLASPAGSWSSVSSYGTLVGTASSASTYACLG